MRFTAMTILMLAACASAGDGTSAVSRAEQAARLYSDLSRENISNPALLPTSGTAQYAGLIALDLPIPNESAPHVGDIDLRVNFGSNRNPISGSATNFNGLSGSLTIASGAIDRGADPDEDYTFEAGLAGTLDGTSGAFVIDGTLSGDFRGRNLDGVTGVVYGDVTGPDGQVLFDGTFAGTQGD